jgi:hypothetical protein
MILVDPPQEEVSRRFIKFFFVAIFRASIPNDEMAGTPVCGPSMINQDVLSDH